MIVLRSFPSETASFDAWAAASSFKDRSIRHRRALLLAVLAALASPSAQGEETKPNPAEPRPAGGADAAVIDDVAVTTGSRGRTVSIVDSPAPIDIVSGEQLRRTGKESLREILGTLVPSLTAPSQPGGGTSASVRPFKLRGLAGDEVLVLVNGKRRHTTAVYNNFGTGSVPVDLDLIPVSAIDHIEVLRDGASAQYGSDAIAGVINIILKRNDQGGHLSVTGGRQVDWPGDLVQPSYNQGFQIGEDGGFLNLSVDVRFQGPSYAAGDALGSFYYPLLNGKPVRYGTPGATPDPRDFFVDRLFQKGYGRSNRDQIVNSAYNFELPVGEGLTLYSFSTLSYRDVVDTRGTYRPNSVNALPEVFPDGFAAQRLIGELDFQFAAGVKGQLLDWNYDFSTTFGRDDARLGAQNTLNASIGPTSKTRFYMGSLQFEQLTTNLDLTRPIDIGLLAKPIQLSWGAEHRYERFVETAGEPDSYRDGGYVIPAGQPRAGQRPPAGLQSFVGTTDRDAGAKSRNSLATYLDVGANVTKEWFTGGAVRFEHYDDSSGNTVSGKISSRYELLPGLAVRGTVNNGFRAPSLAQQIFSVTQSTGVRQPDGTTLPLLAQYLPTGSTLAQALGAKPLKPEKSTNVSVGVTYKPTQNSLITVDAYQLEVNDLIVKGENLVDSGGSTLVRDRLKSLGFSNLFAAQYNANAADARVRGIDIAAELNQDFEDWGVVRWYALYSLNRLSIKNLKPNPPELNFLGGRYTVFGRQAQLQLTQSSPRDKLILGATWRVAGFTTNFRYTRFGQYMEPGTTANLDRYFSAKWIADLEVAYQITEGISLAIGANNLFSVRPDKQPLNSTQTGLGAAFPVQYDASVNYGSFSPFGVNGGFYYARLTYGW